MAFTEFYCNPSTGSNVNAGSTTGAAVKTITGGDWVSSTGVFTKTGAVNSIAVGDFCAVMVDAGTVAALIGRVTAFTANTVTISTTAKSGTLADQTATCTLTAGGVWKGPNAGVNFPFNFITGTLTDASSNSYRVNFKNTANYAITTGITHNVVGPGVFQGYTTTVGDLGRAQFDGAASAGVQIMTVGATANNNDFLDLIFANVGTAGNVGGFSTTGTEINVIRCVAHDCRVSGFSGGANFVECEAYLCNTANNAAAAGFATTSGGTYARCVSHDNAGSNSVGFRATTSGLFCINCIADSNGSDGFNSTATFGSNMLFGCDSYNNTGDGFDLSNASAVSNYIENCNAVKNGAWGFIFSGAGTRNGIMFNSGFGSGTQANGSGTVTGAGGVQEIGSVTYTANQTPWNAPATGDFRIILTAAKNTGRGKFTQTQVSYTGTLSYPNIGSCQNQVPTVPAVGDVRSSIQYGDGGTQFTGTLTVPSINDVQESVSYGAGGTEYTGVFHVPTTSQVLDSVGYGANSSEYTGTVVLPSIDDVRFSITFGPGSNLTGLLNLPITTDVRLSVTYDQGNSTGEIIIPIVDAVRSGITFDISSQGILVLPVEDDVRLTIGYGADGAEFNGNITLPSADSVRDGTSFDSHDSQVGTLVSPNVNNVRLGITYGSGAEHTGNMVLPSIHDVQSGVSYGTLGTELTGVFASPNVSDVQTGVGYGYSSEYIGVFGSPDPGDVRVSIGYGANNTEYIGTLPAGGTNQYINPNTNHTRHSNQEFYELKMLEGQPVDFYYGITRVRDLDTGENITTKNRLTIRRAVITSLVGKYHFYGSADSLYQKDDTIIIVDIKDLPDYVDNKEDYFVWRGKKFLIVSHETIDREGHIFIVRTVQKEEPKQEIVINIRHALTFRQNEVQS